MIASECPKQPEPLFTLPLVLSWDRQANPLPERTVRQPGKPGPIRRGEGLSPCDTGPADRPFDFCSRIRALCADIVRRSPELQHIDVSRLLFGMTQARTTRQRGEQARLTPLRFLNGELRQMRRGVVFQVQRDLVDQQDMLYLMTFCLPRFLDQDFQEKFITLFHELYHINPAFNGDLRRHDGRCDVHSCSKKAYDDYMKELAREYLGRKPDPSLYSFLRLTFAQLCQRHGSVVAVAVPRPKMIPVVTEDGQAGEVSSPVS